MRIECLTYAIEINDQLGWFAGATVAERKGIRKQWIADGLIVRSIHDSTRVNAAKHGTNSGYQAHFRLREKPCEPCRLAHNAARRRAS